MFAFQKLTSLDESIDLLKLYHILYRVLIFLLMARNRANSNIIIQVICNYLLSYILLINDYVIMYIGITLAHYFFFDSFATYKRRMRFLAEGYFMNKQSYQR